MHVLMLTVSFWIALCRLQIGDGSTSNRLTPPVADVLTGVTMLVDGMGRTCALMITSGVRCWGWNNDGQASTCSPLYTVLLYVYTCNCPASVCFASQCST